MKRSVSRYFRQLFFNGIFFGLFPALLLGICLYYYSYRTIMANVRKTTAQSRLQIQMSIEQTLRLQERQLFNFLTDTAINNLMFSSPPFSSQFQMIEQVRSGMNKLLIYDLGIDDWILVNLKNDWMLSSSGMSNLSKISARFHIRDIMVKSDAFPWYTDFVLKDDITPSNTMRWILPQTVKHTRTISNYGGEESGYISISIPCSYYSKLLALDENAEDILIVEESGIIVANKGANLAGTPLMKSAYGIDLKDIFQVKEEGFMQSRGGRRIFSLSKSTYNQWLYIYISNTRVMLRDVFILRNITVCAGFLIILAVILFAFSRARLFYKPVSMLYTRLGGETTEILNEGGYSAGDEFKVIDAHLETILRKKKKLEEEVMRQSQLGRELFVHKILNGEITGGHLAERINLYHFPECPAFCRVSLIQIESLEDSRYEKNDRDWLLIALSNIGTELMADILCFPIMVDGGSIVMIIGMAARTEEHKNVLSVMFEKFLERVHETLRVDITICVSANVDSYDMLHERRDQAADMFKHQVRYSQNGLLFFEDMEEAPVSQPQFPQGMEEDIIHALRQRDIKETDSALEAFIRYIMENENFRRSCYFMFSRLLADILRLVQEYNLEQSWSGKPETAFEQLFTLKSWQQIFGWFKKNFTDPLLLSMGRRISPKETALIQQMQQIAETRYDNYLSIEIISEEFVGSPSFLRKVFKSGTGMSFNSYLTNCRMEAAKKMLAETEMRISDIAKRLTYQNSQNFIRTFRIQIGMTPGEYRRMKRNDF